MSGKSVVDRLQEYIKDAAPGEVFRVIDQDVATLDPGSVSTLNAFIEQCRIGGYFSVTPGNRTIRIQRNGPKENPGGGEAEISKVPDAAMAQAQSLFTDKAGEEQRITLEPSDNPFRPRYRKLSLEELAHHDLIKSKATDLLSAINDVPKVRSDPTDGEGMANLKLSFRHLEDAVYRAVKALTA